MIKSLLLIKFVKTSLYNDMLLYVIISIFYNFSKRNIHARGSGSSVGIATDDGLDGPGSNPIRTRFSARSDRPWGPPSLL